MTKSVRIGCYGAMWGDWPLSAPQLLNGGNVNYLVCDYLAEVTMAILAMQKMKNPQLGYATDFVRTMGELLPQITKQGVKVVVNAGGVNVESCRKALLDAANAAKVDVKVGIVLGDDISSQFSDIKDAGTKDMFTGQDLPPFAVSTNAYLGAFPIAQLLRDGCNIVVTGRVVDSAMVLGPLIHEFGWGPQDLDKLSQGTLAGHLVECGAQGTGGLFTDWRSVESWVNIGYPIVDVQPSGDFILTKPPGTDGLVIPASAAEQLLYEIHDPGAYHVPDVACDWTQVRIEQAETHAVRVTGARGQPPTDSYKCICTAPTGFRFVSTGTVVGHEAVPKAQRVGETLLTRWRKLFVDGGHGDFTDSRIETIGGGNGASLRVSVKHPDRKALNMLKRESAAASVSMAQGGMMMPGDTSPVATATCFVVKKSQVPCHIDAGAGPVPFNVNLDGGFVDSASNRVTPVQAAAPNGTLATMPLRALCWARSGDKGDAANIGLIARRPEYLAFLRHAVTCERVREFFQPDCKGIVERFDLPGIHAMNFLLHNALGGGGTSSLHADPLAKTLGQRLLEMHVDAPADWLAGPSKL